MENEYKSKFDEYKDKAIDIFMFREGTDEDEHGSSQPVITTGSVVWGMIFRSAVIVFLTFVIIDQFEIRSNWWIFSFILWFAAIYPGWRQYNKFTTRIKKIEEETLCGSCRHFEPSSQLCRIYDEHVTKDHIPCEGLNWEPKRID
jgi:hypothetical protein